MPAQNHRRSSHKEPLQNLRGFFSPCFLTYLFFFLALCFLKNSFPWKPFRKEKALEVLAFAGCAFFPSTSSLLRGAENNPIHSLGWELNPQLPNPSGMLEPRCRDDTKFQPCQGAALVPPATPAIWELLRPGFRGGGGRGDAAQHPSPRVSRCLIKTPPSHGCHQPISASSVRTQGPGEGDAELETLPGMGSPHWQWVV